MSIVGTQAVSMGDLMKLGVPALNAMAQGQAKTIAPSYMVIAALKALTDQQKGMSSPVPQATVKDQVVAQAQPMQAGIGQMQPPVQRMAGGGQVESYLQPEFDDPAFAMFDFRSDAQKAASGSRRGPLFDLRTQAQKEAQRRARYPQSDVEGGRGKVNPPAVLATQGTDATDYGNEQLRTARPQATAPNADPTSVSAGYSASAKSRGIGGTENPLSKYAKLGKMPTAESFTLDIPKNAQLEAAAAKFSKPDAERMAELRAAEENAGLSAFARGMVDPKRGRGFGAVFGAAAADYNDTKEARADKRREYEDRREALGTQLGIQIGDNARQDFLKKSEWGAQRANEAFDQGIKTLQAENQAIHFGNQEVLEREKINMMAAANAIQAQIRRDGMTASHADKIQKLYLTAQEIAIKAAESKYGKSDPMLAMTPEGQQREQAKQRLYEAEYSKAVSALEARLGGEGNSMGASNAVVRKAY